MNKSRLSIDEYIKEEVSSSMTQYYIITNELENKYWYGIGLLDNENGTNTILDEALYLTQDYGSINMYVDKLNRGNLSRMHFRDFLEDWFAQ